MTNDDIGNRLIQINQIKTAVEFLTNKTRLTTKENSILIGLQTDKAILINQLSMLGFYYSVKIILPISKVIKKKKK